MLFTSSRGILLTHIERLKTVVTLRSKNDKKNAAFFERDLYKIAARHKTLSRLRGATFVLLYASVLSTALSDLPVLSDVATSITAIAGVVGVGVLGALALFLTWRMNRLWNRMLLLYGHIVAIYEKNNAGLYTAEELPPEKASRDA